MMRLLLLCLLAFSSTLSFSQTVSTWAGKAKTSGTTSNGSGSGAVRFNEPWGMTYDRQGNLWVTNAGSHAVFMMRQSDSKFYVRAGKQNSSGYVNSSGINAQFSQPMGISIGAKIYIADAGNHCIRQMDTFKALGTIQAVSLLAGKNGSSGHKDGTGSAAEFDTPTDVAVDSKGNIYVADQGNHVIRKITVAGVVTTYAGQVGSSGSANGDKDSKAKFNWPTGLFIDANDNVYVADKNNYKIRKIDASTGSVSTVYTTANFQTPEQVYVAPNGTIVASGGCQIQAFLGTDTLFLGNHPRNCGFKNDKDTNALLDDARGILPLSTTDFIFLDRDNHIIRKIAVDPCDVVKASITAGGATRFCEGGSVTLSSSPLVTNKWTWGSSGSSTGSSVKADENGYYKLEISAVISGSTCSDTTGIFITVDDNPTPSISVTGNLTFCPGGEVDLEADQAYNKYAWTTSESTKAIKVQTAGTFGLEVTDGNGCVGKATDVTTSIHSTTDPTITANGAAEFCDGGSVELEASAGFSSYKWSESSTGSKVTVTQGGSYTVTATDNNGCETTSMGFDVTVNPLPAKPSIASDNDSVYTTATATEYIWYYEGSEESRTTVAYIIADKDGNYSVEVVDDKGCSNTSDMENVTIIGIKGSTANNTVVYPNPSSGIFNIPTNWIGSQYSVIDLTGRKVAFGTLNSAQLNLKELTEGTYLIRANADNGQQTTRLIIKK